MPACAGLRKSLLRKSDKEIRFVKVKNYKVAYWFTGQEVIILRVYYSKRNPSDILKGYLQASRLHSVPTLPNTIE